ncbi:hypothetical protein FOL46_000298 [Perkinsus olseni]|uniref:Uncharacterized protein n=1 Tax=Perkinsus olseni TaxID=32597 RepID=A0A7J6MIX5_PEROL|nr:hypothetical protein FOL46_000298 [Perkinsus olseni]
MRFLVVFSLATTASAKSDWLTRIARATGVVSSPPDAASTVDGADRKANEWHVHQETVSASYAEVNVDGVRTVSGSGSRTTVEGGSDTDIKQLREDWAIWSPSENDTKSAQQMPVAAVEATPPPPPPPVVESTDDGGAGPQPSEALDLPCGPRWQESKRLLASVLMRPEASLQLLGDSDLIVLEQAVSETLPVDLLTTTADCGLARLVTQLMGVVAAVNTMGADSVSESVVSNEKLHSPLMTVVVDITWADVHASGWPFFPLLAQWQLRNLPTGLPVTPKEGLDHPLIGAYHTNLSTALTTGDLAGMAVISQQLLSDEASADDAFVRANPLPFATALAAVAVSTDSREYRASLLSAAQEIIAFGSTLAQLLPIGGGQISRRLRLVRFSLTTPYVLRGRCGPWSALPSAPLAWMRVVLLVRRVVVSPAAQGSSRLPAQFNDGLLSIDGPAFPALEKLSSHMQRREAAELGPAASLRYSFWSHGGVRRWCQEDEGVSPLRQSRYDASRLLRVLRHDS